MHAWTHFEKVTEGSVSTDVLVKVIPIILVQSGVGKLHSVHLGEEEKKKEKNRSENRNTMKLPHSVPTGTLKKTDFQAGRS